MISIKFVILLLIAYMLGNISPSTILAKAKGIDIKKAGSGNAGTTNALRVLGAKAAVITLVIDIGKGFLAVFIAGMFLCTSSISRTRLAFVAKIQGRKRRCYSIWSATGTQLAARFDMPRYSSTSSTCYKNGFTRFCNGSSCIPIFSILYGERVSSCWHLHGSDFDIQAQS